MTAPTLEQLPVRVPGATLQPDLVHVTCCRDDDPAEIALYDTDVTNDPWASPNAQTTCVVCAYLDNAIERADSCVGICPLARGGAS